MIDINFNFPLTKFPARPTEWKIIEEINTEAKMEQKLTPGQIVHYYCGDNSWIRCEVQPDQKLKALAFVGNWSKCSLPYRSKSGEEILPHYSIIVKTNAIFFSTSSNLWEFNKTSQDPTNLPEINITLPPLTEQEQENIKLWKKIQLIETNLYGDDPKTVINKIREILDTP